MSADTATALKAALRRGDCDAARSLLAKVPRNVRRGLAHKVGQACPRTRPTTLGALRPTDSEIEDALDVATWKPRHGPEKVPVRFADWRSRNEPEMTVGDTFESEKWRVHLYREQLLVTSITEAGKRGKVCASYTLRNGRQDTPWQHIATEAAKAANREVSVEKMHEILSKLRSEYDVAYLDLGKSKCVEVMPGTASTLEPKSPKKGRGGKGGVIVYETLRHKDRVWHGTKHPGSIEYGAKAEVVPGERVRLFGVYNPRGGTMTIRPKDAREPDAKGQALKELVYRNPKDADAWSVYGDYLQSKGDPLGEVIAQRRQEPDGKLESMLCVGYCEKDYKPPTAYDRTFKVGDTVVTGSYNLTYTGRIAEITEKTVSVMDVGGRKQFTLAEFSDKNRDLDLDAISKRNSEWSD